MRALFIGMFVVALLAGLVTKGFLNSSDQTSLFAHFLNDIGVKKIDKKAELQQVLDQEDNQNKTTQQLLKDQKEYLTYSKDQIGGLSQIIKQMSDHDSSVDLLRIKDLMRQFEDKNSLLIENGDRLIEENKRIMSNNQKIKREFDANAIKTDVEQNQLLEAQKNNLTSQKERINRQIQDTEALNDKMKEIKREIKNKQDDAIFKRNPQILDQVEALSLKTSSFIDHVKERQEQINRTSEANTLKMNDLKEKVQDLKNKNIESTYQKNSLDKSQALNDRIKDQMQALKDQRMR